MKWIGKYEQTIQRTREPVVKRLQRAAGKYLDRLYDAAWARYKESYIKEYGQPLGDNAAYREYVKQAEEMYSKDYVKIVAEARRVELTKNALEEKRKLEGGNQISVSEPAPPAKTLIESKPIVASVMTEPIPPDEKSPIQIGVSGVAVVCAFMLLWPLAGNPPYSYYSLMKYTVAAGSVLVTYVLWNVTPKLAPLCFLLIATGGIHLMGKMHRAEWLPYDLAAFWLFALSALILFAIPITKAYKAGSVSKTTTCWFAFAAFLVLMFVGFVWPTPYQYGYGSEPNVYYRINRFTKVTQFWGANSWTPPGL